MDSTLTAPSRQTIPIGDPTPQPRPICRPPTPGDPISWKRRRSLYSIDTGTSSLGAGTMKNPMRLANVRRWDPRTKTKQPWDGLRRDYELYHPTGDCLVHLYAKGQSQRGPSFNVDLKRVLMRRCQPMFELFYAAETAESASNRTYGAPTAYELFIPAPKEAMREEAFQWHITTRNFFAFLFDKPLVGKHLGRAFVDLQERLNLFRTKGLGNQDDMEVYLDKAGYLDFGHNVDYALAVLYYAEHYKIRDLWIDAFAHCVGMNDELSQSSEFEPISLVTKALITRAYLEMDLHLARASKSLSNFLEDELSGSYLGLSSGARDHLDHFRSFLHQYYVKEFGYWPPPEQSHLSKSLFKLMYADFTALYDYLVDVGSPDSMVSERLPSGGICVLQNVQAFDKRHGYAPLSHPLPLLPDAAFDARFQSQRARLPLTLGPKNTKIDRQFWANRVALQAATNTQDPSVVTAPLVHAYRQFEQQHAAGKNEKVSLADARKVRWILIYALLQTLISVTRAPKEVRDADTPTYSLCCLVSGLPSWNDSEPGFPLDTPTLPSASRPCYARSISVNAETDVNGMPTIEKALPETPTFEIRPDCETDADFLNSRNNSSNSLSSLARPNDMSSPARSASRLGRSMSKRATKAFSLGNFAARRNSVVIKPPPPTFCEIIVHGYGNGLNTTTMDNGNKAAEQASESVGCSQETVIIKLDTQQSHMNLPINGGDVSDMSPRTYHPWNALTTLSSNIPEQLRNLNRIEDLKRRMKNAPQSPDSVGSSPKSDGGASSPAWSVARRGSGSSRATVYSQDDQDKEGDTSDEDVAQELSRFMPEFFEAGGLLRSSGFAYPAAEGIMVHKSFSVEHFKLPPSKVSEEPTPVRGWRKIFKFRDEMGLAPTWRDIPIELA